jgi:hypothetical protein
MLYTASSSLSFLKATADVVRDKWAQHVSPTTHDPTFTAGRFSPLFCGINDAFNMQLEIHELPERKQVTYS